MIEKTVQIKTADGTSEGFLYQPENSGQWPGVIFLTDIGGIRPATKDMAKRVAGEGYVVLLPNVFYRSRKPPMFDFQPKFDGKDERTMKRLGELRGPFTPDAQERDNGAYIAFLSARDSVRGNLMGVQGYCITGSTALRMAAAHPDKIGAAASFHGGGLYADAPDSPHTLLPRVKASLYFGHAMNDHSMPQEAIDKFQKALAAWGGRYESETYNALHGWTVPGGPMYDEPEAERAYKKLKALYAATLK